jgi:hypothetical protein
VSAVWTNRQMISRRAHNHPTPDPDSDEGLVVDVIGHQLEHFRHAETPSRGMELPDGIILRHYDLRGRFISTRTGTIAAT